MIKSNHPNIRSLFRSLLLTCVLSIIGFLCFGQSGDRLPDSIGSDQTIESTTIPDTAPGGSVHQDQSVEDSSNENAKDKDLGLGDSVQFRAVPDSVVKRMKQDKDFAYANNPAYWKKEESGNRNDMWFRMIRWIRSSVWVTRFLYIILGGTVAFAIYVIAVRNRLFIFYSSPGKKKAEVAEEIESNGEGLDEKIEAAVEAGNYRLALRYMYLRTLKTADEKGLIQFMIQKTNSEYVSELRGKAIAREFGFLTAAYEWAWYGGFEIRAEQFRPIKEQYDILNKKMGN
ncbi:MAG: DUF4129 domain-containing protein [Chitinophagales bacterium]